VGHGEDHADAGGRTKRFADVEGLREWLTENGMDDAAVADVADVRALRDALVTVLLGHSGGPGTDDAALAAAEEHLSRAAVRHPLLATVDRRGAHLSPAQGGLPGAVGRVLAAMAELALTDTWVRLKACRNQHCHLAFHDRSRNTSGAYCSPRCSTQVAMRAHRRRRAASSGRPTPDAGA